MNNPETHKNDPSVSKPAKSLQAELLEIVKQNREVAEALKAQEAHPKEVGLHSTEQPVGVEASETKQISENEKYLSDLMHHMKIQQPDIYWDALSRIVAERNATATEPVNAQELDRELEERITKQNNIPAGLLSETTNQMRTEEVNPNSKIWEDVNANGFTGNIARSWRDMYQRAMNEILK